MFEEDEEKIIPIPPKIFRIGKFKFTVKESVLIPAISILLFVVIILAVLLGSSSNSHTETRKHQICLESSCLWQASFVLKNMDLNVKPCDDFYQYACGNFHKEITLDPSQSKKDIYDFIWERNSDKLKKILERPSIAKQNTNDPIRLKIQNFIYSCRNNFQRQSLGSLPLIQAIEEYGGWAVLGTWNEKIFNLTTLITNDQTKYQTLALFRFDVRPDFLNEKDRSIIIYFDGVGMSKWEYYTQRLEEIYKSFIRDVASLVVRDSHLRIADKKKEIEDFVESVYNFELKLSNITQNFLYYGQINIDEIQNQTDEVHLNLDWMIVLREYFGKNVTKKTVISVFWREYITGLLNLLKQSSQKQIQDYFIWRLMFFYIRDLTWEYAHKYDMFFQNRYHISKSENLWDYCFNKANEVMGLGISHLFIKDHFAEDSKRQVDLIFRDVREHFISAIDDFEWMDAETKISAKRKVKTIREYAGYPEWVYNSTEIILYYNELKISKNNYFQNLLNINMFKRVGLALSLENRNQKDYRLIVQTYETQSSYNYLSNSLMFPAGMLQHPIYDPLLPNYMNYGAMAYLIAKQIFESIDELGRFYNDKGNVELWWTMGTLNMYSVLITACFRNSFIQDYLIIETNATLETFPVKMDSYQRSGISDVVGLKHAYQTYKNWEATNGKEDLLPGLPIKTPDQAFFVSFAQLFCQTRTDYQRLIDANKQIYPNSYRVHNAVSQMKEFSDAYGCRHNSFLTQFTRCPVYPV